MKKIVPQREYEIEIKVINSRFIASLSPAHSVDEARAYIQEIKNRYADAHHHVPAFVIGHGRSITAHSSDDGEPSGTAGKPALAVLKGSGFGDVVVVVTRFFGGTKLGTGGLVRAYGDAVRAVLGITKAAEVILVNHLQMIIPYPHYEVVKRLLRQGGFESLQEDFTDIVTISGVVQTAGYESLCSRLIDITNGKARINLLEEMVEKRIPLKEN